MPHCACDRPHAKTAALEIKVYTKCFRCSIKVDRVTCLVVEMQVFDRKRFSVFRYFGRNAEIWRFGGRNSDFVLFRLSALPKLGRTLGNAFVEVEIRSKKLWLSTVVQGSL